MRIALVETDTLWEDPAGNRERIPSAVPDADVAVLPEMAFTGFTMHARPDPDAEPFLTGLARERGLALVAGCIGGGEPGSGAPTNRAVAVSREGRVLARYDKRHPFTFVGEDRHYRAGRALPVFALGEAKAAMLVCYDLRFPEDFREAARHGADLFFVLGNWPSARIDHWRTLLRARAIENQAFVVGVNRIGRDPNADYTSSSLAVDPKGVVLHEGAGVVDIDVRQAAHWRREFPALDDYLATRDD